MFFSVWLWKGDEGEWEPYPSDVCVQLDTAKQAGEKSVSLALGPGYEVDLVKMTQTNTVTKYKRKIRLQKVKSGMYPCLMFGMSICHRNLIDVFFCVAEDLNDEKALNGKNEATGVVQIKEEKEEEDEQPVSKKRRNEGRSQKANKAKPVVKEESEGSSTFLFV